MLQIIGWVIWAIVVFFAISFAIGCRVYAKSGLSFHWATGVQTFFLWLIAILFLLFDWNKLHLLWVVPTAYFGAQVLAIGGVPILTPIVLFITRIFLNTILIGINQPWYVSFLLLGSLFVVVMITIQKGILRGIGYALSVVLAIVLVNCVTMLLMWWDNKRKNR